MSDEFSNFDPKYEEIEQARRELDPWVTALDDAYDIFIEASNHLKTCQRNPSAKGFPEFDQTFLTVVEQTFSDSTWAYFNSNSRVFDPDNISHTVLNNLGLAPVKMQDLPRVSRLGTYQKGVLPSFQPTLVDNSLSEGKIIRLRMENMGFLIFTKTDEFCSIEMEFSQMDNTRRGKKMTYPFKSVAVGFSKAPSGNSWRLHRGFHLTDDYKELGFQSALQVHPELAREEANLLKGLLDCWCALPEDPYKAKFEHYVQSNLGPGFQIRIIKYLSRFSPDFAREFNAGGPITSRTIGDFLNNHPDLSSYIQYLLFE